MDRVPHNKSKRRLLSIKVTLPNNKARILSAHLYDAIIFADSYYHNYFTD